MSEIERLMKDDAPVVVAFLTKLKDVIGKHYESRAGFVNYNDDEPSVDEEDSYEDQAAVDKVIGFIKDLVVGK